MNIVCALLAGITIIGPSAPAVTDHGGSRGIALSIEVFHGSRPTTLLRVTADLF